MLAYGHYGLFVWIQTECNKGSFLTKWWIGKLPYLGSRYSTLLCTAWHNKWSGWIALVKKSPKVFIELQVSLGKL
jgi:hypothetical protein